MIRRVYAEQRAAAGGTWHTHIAAAGATGVPEPLVADDADHVTLGYSVQKLAVATAVLDKVDSGGLSGHRVPGRGSTRRARRTASWRSPGAGRATP
jgi:hypothetical protein